MFLIVSPKTWQSIWIVFKCAIDKKRIKLKKLYFHSSNQTLRCVNNCHEYWCWYWWGSTNFRIMQRKNLIVKYAQYLNIWFTITFIFSFQKYKIIDEYLIKDIFACRLNNYTQFIIITHIYIVFVRTLFCFNILWEKRSDEC